VTPRDGRRADRWGAGWRADGGSAGLLAVWAALVVLTATTAALVWGAALVARHRVERTADLAALAAAGAAVRAAALPCGAAVRVAREAGGVVSVCTVLPDRSVLVVVALAVPQVVPGLDMPPARARARAGAVVQ
jgi:secretion/DNA translocation related TadE-like protein